MTKWKCYTFEKVSSTNEIAKDYQEGSQIQALEQTKGRGRRARSWISNRGNLYLSFVVHKKYAVNALSLSMALAVFHAIKAFDEKIEVKLKWPNDVLLLGKKVSGILIERENAFEKGDKLIIGIGVNLISSPKEGLIYNAISLKEAGIGPSLEELKEKVSGFVSLYLQKIEEGKEDEIIKEFSALSFKKGEKITLHAPQGKKEGRYVGLTKEGALKLEINEKEEIFYVGDVLSC